MVSLSPVSWKSVIVPEVKKLCDHYVVLRYEKEKTSWDEKKYYDKMRLFGIVIPTHKKKKILTTMYLKHDNFLHTITQAREWDNIVNRGKINNQKANRLDSLPLKIYF